MKKFFYKAIIFLIIGSLIFILLNILADNYDSQRVFRITQLLDKRDSINALAVGNSHTCAFDFRTLKMNGYRVAQGGNDVFETDYQLRALVPMLPNLKVVLFNISYFSLYEDNSAIPNDYCYYTKEEYYLFLSRYPKAKFVLNPVNYSDFILIDTKKINSQQENILGPAYREIMNRVSDGLGLRKSYYKSIPSFSWVKGDIKNFFECKFSLIIRQDHWKEIIYSLFQNHSILNPNEYYKMDKFGQTTKGLAYTHKNPDSLNEMAKKVQVPGYINSCKVMAYFKNDIPKETYKCLVSVIKYLRQRNIKLIFITTPVYKSFTKYYNKNYIGLMKSNMNRLKKEYGIEYYNFSTDTTFSFNNKFFYNSDHLNKTGAKEFSKQLFLLMNKNNNDKK
ncbi:MAG: hypothetical protein P8Z35_15635 [Ignavibacteriaceae bacterium]